MFIVCTTFGACGLCDVVTTVRRMGIITSQSCDCFLCYGQQACENTYALLLVSLGYIAVMLSGHRIMSQISRTCRVHPLSIAEVLFPLVNIFPLPQLLGNHHSILCF